jgi:hypothetical protein
MTENLPMLPMKWGIIEVAREAGADILPAFLSYCNEKEACSVQFGKAMRIDGTKDQLEAINELRDALATLFWKDWENKPVVKRKQLNKKEEQKRIWSYVEEYPPIQWEYERKCIFSAKGNTRPDEAFAFMSKLVPSRANAFLFDKRNKF